MFTALAALGYSLLGYIRFWKGQLADAEDFVRAGLQLADRLGPGGAHAQWYALGGLIEILLARGETAAAQELAAARRFGKPFPSVVTLPDASARSHSKPCPVPNPFVESAAM